MLKINRMGPTFQGQSLHIGQNQGTSQIPEKLRNDES